MGLPFLVHGLNPEDRLPSLVANICILAIQALEVQNSKSPVGQVLAASAA